MVSRDRKFYGKSIVEGVQKPTETIYIPNTTPHTVINLDETVAVGDNPFFSTGIEESAFELQKYQKNSYGFIKDSKIFLQKGLFAQFRYPFRHI